MNVLIKGMEMPKNCWECSLSDVDDDYGRCCLFSGIACLNIGRQDNCPLVEVPSNIDLIDKNKLYEKVAKWEAQALEQASKLAQTDNIEEWRRWYTILNERTAFKFDVIDAPVIIGDNN